MDVDVESDVADLYSLCGFELSAPPPWWAILERLFGPDGLDYVPRHGSMLGKAELTRRPELVAGITPSLPYACLAPDYYVRIWARVRAIEVGFLAMHEAIEWLKITQGYRREHIEDHCNRAAAGVLMPGPSLTSAIRKAVAQETAESSRFTLLARRYRVTQACAAMRYAEWTDTPLIVYRPHRSPVIRGRLVPWGTEHVIRWMWRTDYLRPGTRRAFFDRPENGGVIWIEDEEKFDSTPRPPGSA